MPLIHGKSKNAFSHNVGAEMDAGKPQKQALAIAYQIMRKNRNKMAMGGELGVSADEIKKRRENNPAASEAGKAAGDIPTRTGIYDDNSDKDPSDSEEVFAARGGMMKPPQSIARMIAYRKMNKGGMAECYPDGGEVVDPDKAKRFSKGFNSVFAEGGEVEGDFDLDSDSEAESLPFEDEDAVHIPALGYDSAREDTEGQHERANEEPGKKRKGMLDRIMRGLRSEHYGMK